jgi:hypothetical protein
VTESGQVAEGRFRYLLWRQWEVGARVLFVMLNPSVADAERDDPTIRRCRGLARAWGFGAVEVANLFALRATDPRDLARARRRVGPRNDEILLDAVGRADAIIVAWGVHGALDGRDRAVARLLDGRALRCLGRTRAGQPRHPLYVRRDVVTHPWAPGERAFERAESVRAVPASAADRFGRACEDEP